MFKAYKFYVQIKRDQIKAIDLITGNEVTENALTPFSTARIVLASFNPAKEVLSAALRQLGAKWSLSGSKIVIQQIEGCLGGLSDIEKRALRDLAELAGGTKVFLVETEKPISNSEALQLMER